MISAADLNRVLVEALPELAADRSAYEQKQIEDPECLQTFIGFSFIPTLQVALDRNAGDFSRRAFALIERLLAEGDDNVQAILRDEFFDYGPACEKWMRRAGNLMGPLTRKAAAEQ